MSDRDANRSWLSGTRGAIARRDLASLKREKTIVLALLIQLFVAAFSSFLVVGLTSLYDPGAVESGGIEMGVSGEYTEQLVSAADEVDGVEVAVFEDSNAAMAAFDGGDVHAVLEAQPRQTGSGSVVDVTAVAPAESLRSTLIVVQVRNVLSELEVNLRDERAANLDFQTVPTPAKTDASPYFGFTYTVLIPLLLFLPPFISGSIAVDAITEEIERGTLELLRVAPVSLVDVVEGKAMGMILLAPAQVVLWLGLLSLNGIAVANPLSLLVLVTAITTVVVVLGVVLGLVTRQRRRAQLLYSVLVLVLFGLAALLPEHPATTVAKLAVASGTTLTIAHVVGFAALAVAAYAGTRQFVGRVDPESL
ncbi:ABC transporter permease [Halobacteriales archaeon Cl-PHB]